MENLIPSTSINQAQAADLLQNDISQTLSAVLLWMQTAMAEEAHLSANIHLRLAEGHLKESVKKLVRLHYSLLNNTEDKVAAGMHKNGIADAGFFSAPGMS